MTTTSIPPAAPRRRGHPIPPIDPRIAERRAAVAADANRVRKRQLIVALAVLAAGVVGFAVLQSPLFAVDRITVAGAVSDPRGIIDASGVKIGSPLINVDLTEARRSIAALPAVAQVSSHRDWNGEVVFDVVEREPVAQIRTADGSVLIVDAAGRIISRSGADAPSVAPVVIGGLEPVDDGSARWVDDVAARAVHVAAAIPPDIVKATAQLTVTPYDYRLELGNGAEAVLGDISSIDDQMRALRSVLVSIDLGCVASVDLQNPQSPVIRRSPGCGGAAG